MPDNAKTPNEPSMEEIIASISRIISEEKRPIEPASPAAGEKTNILELTEVVDEDGSVRRVTPSPTKLNASSGESGATAISSVTNSIEQSEPMPGHPDRGTEPRRDLGRERILSSVKSGAAAAAFAQLGGLPRERHRQGELLLGGADRTLAVCSGRYCKPGLMNIFPASSNGWFEKKSRALSAKRGSAERRTSEARTRL